MKASAAAVASVLLACGRTGEPVANGAASRVAVEVRGPGRVLSLPPAIDCPGICAAAFPRGAAVTLVAAPAENGLFREWAGDCAGATGCHLSVSADAAVRAEFDPQ
jgi:hypothetical protein